MSDKEKRIIKATLELREGDGGARSFRGYAAIFNQPSVDMGFIETVAPGAFKRTLAANPDVIANIQHEGGLSTIGRTKNGTLTLSTDDVGLLVDITPPDTQAGRDALTLVSGGYVDQMSFAFMVKEHDWRKEDDQLFRTLLDVELDGGDVAIVTGPAYPQTTVEVRAEAAALSEAGDDAIDEAEEAARLEAQRANRKRRYQILKERTK